MSTDTLPRLTSVASIKRVMQPGSRWRFRSDWAPTSTLVRTVLKVQTNGVGLTSLRGGDRDGPSWFYWPKAANVHIHEDGRTFTLRDPDFPDYWLEYELVATAAQNGR